MKNWSPRGSPQSKFCDSSLHRFESIGHKGVTDGRTGGRTVRHLDDG